MKRWELVRALCESPIEELYMAGVFASGIDNSSPVHVYAGGTYRPETELFDGDHLWPQAHIGNYRVDFLFVNVSRGRRRLVVVECDGHDFHERTKEQAAADKARDRFLVGHGYQVLRFTGSEIYRDPFGCWAETLNVLWDVADAA
jgi:very-short-patch-repair endonuclease